MKIGPRILPFFIALPGLVIIAFTFPALSQRWDFVHHAVSAKAKVVGFESEADTRPPPHGGLIFHSVFAFKDQSGVRHRARTEKASYPAAYHKGDKIVVLYLPNDPDTVKVRSFSELWGDSGMVACIGAAFSICGIIVAGLSMPRRSKRSGPTVCPAVASDNLEKFNNALKTNFADDCPAIYSMAAEVLKDVAASPIHTKIDDNEFPKFVASLDYVSSEKVKALTTITFNSELTRGSDVNDPVVGRIHGGVRGWGAPGGQEVTVLELAQHQLLFVRWNEDSTQVFKDDQVIARVQGTFNKRVTVQIGDKDVIAIKYPTWWWQKTMVTLNGSREILFPKTWPNPNGLDDGAVTALAAIDFKTQLLLIAVLLWRNNYTGAL